ncbi:MAG: hypothetical protein IJV46_00235 [Acidaminococcaceae bacterium]|nr:hypothetical protein [Acidaminococcaceae bacterium]
MKKTWADRLAVREIYKERRRQGAEFLENIAFCNGRAVVVKAKFDAAGREENKLIFSTIRPFNERIKTLPKIFDRLVFLPDTLWKVRLLEKAEHQEQFYIIGRIKVVYENGRPRGELVSAEDIYTPFILTESQFEAHYEKFCSWCYKWPRIGEMKKAAISVVRRMQITMVHKNEHSCYLRMPVWNRPLRNILRCSRTMKIKSWEVAQSGVLENETVTENCERPVSEPKSVQDLSQQKETLMLEALLQKSNGRELDDSVQQAAELGCAEIKPEEFLPGKPQAGEFQLLKDCLEGHNVESADEATLGIFNSPLGMEWILEFGTVEQRVVWNGCTCQFSDGIIYINSEVELWLIRYSELLGKMILYHKNRKGYRINTDREPIRGYHVQHIQSLPGLKSEEMHECKKLPLEKLGLLPSKKGTPTIKDYLKYICQHRELAEERNKLQERKKKNLRNLMKNKNTSYETKQKKKKRMRKEIKRERARDVLYLLKMLKNEG